MKETFLTIQKYLANEEWVSKQDDDILNAIRQCEGIVADVTTHLYIFVNYFEQYVQAITDSPLFGNGDADDKNDNISTGPTQTPAPANRAEKRAATKKQPEPIVP
jgi:hypothetical protein